MNLSPKIKNLASYSFEMLLMLFLSLLANPLTNWIASDIIRPIVRDVFLRVPIALLTFRWVHRARYSETRVNSIRISISYRSVVWIGIGFIPPLLIVAIYWLFGWVLPPQLKFVSLSEIGFLFLVTFTSALSISIIEETLFRGYLFEVFEYETNRMAAIFFPSFLFGVVHLPTLNEYSVVNIFLIIVGGTLFGVFLSLVVNLTRRLESVVALHLMWNFLLSDGLIVFFRTLPVEANDYLPLLFTTDNSLITGGNAGVQVGIPALLVYVLGIMVLIALYKNKECA